MEDFTSLIALAALAVKITSLLKYLTAGQVRSAATTVVPWLAAFAVLALAAQADATAAMTLPGMNMPLADVDIASLMLASTALGATGSLVYDISTRLDNTDDTSKEPPLGG